MTESTESRLFALTKNPYFPEGTLFELCGLTLPDRGDGEPAEINASVAMECEPFAENVPPGQCPVQITSFRTDGGPDGVSGVRLDQTIHWQVLEMPIPNGSIMSVDVLDQARGFEADHYEAPSDELVEHYRLHIGHLRPGFYETRFKLTEEGHATLTFIKHYPDSFVRRSVRAKPKVRVGESPVPSGPKMMLSQSCDEDIYPVDLLNAALELATEWGENFGKPINERILAKYPGLTADEIADLTKRSREAEYYIYSLAERELAGDISEAEIPGLAIQKYPWLSRQNTARLTGIGMFYARK